MEGQRLFLPGGEMVKHNCRCQELKGAEVELGEPRKAEREGYLMLILGPESSLVLKAFELV